MSIQVTRLPNGLRVATDTMETVETVSLGAWVEAGTRNETPDINGVSHLLEHMAFKGTDRRTARDIAEEIEAVGGHLNAYTSRENTAYFAKVLKEDARLATDIIADILQHSTLDPEELARERAVVLQEIGQALDTPDDIVFDYFQETAYPNQGLGRPVLGTAELVANMPRETILDYLHRHYSPPRIVVSAAGRIEHEAFVEMVGNAFVDLPSVEPSPYERADYRGGDFREARDLEQVHVVLGFDGVAYEDPDYYPNSVLSTLLGGGMSSRLFQEIRERRGLVYSIYSFTSNYEDGGLFGVYAGTGEDEVAEMMPVMIDEIRKVAQDGVGEDELVRARVQLRASLLMSLESNSSRCETLARQLMIFGRPIPVSEIVDRIEAVDAAAVERSARRMLATPPTLAVLGPLANVEPLERIVGRLNG